MAEYREEHDFSQRLVNALGHPVLELREWAALLLGHLKDPRSLPSLMQVAKEDEDIFVVRQAVRSLGAMDSPEVREFLRTLVNHPAMIVRKEVHRILGALEEQTPYQTPDCYPP